MCACCQTRRWYDQFCGCSECIDAPLTILQVTYRKEDNGKPLRITAGDRILFADKLDYSGDSDTYDVKYIIPKEVIDENVRTVQVNNTEYDVIDIGFSASNAEKSALKPIIDRERNW